MDKADSLMFFQFLSILIQFQPYWPRKRKWLPPWGRNAFYQWNGTQLAVRLANHRPPRPVLIVNKMAFHLTRKNFLTLTLTKQYLTGPCPRLKGCQSCQERHIDFTIRVIIWVFFWVLWHDWINSPFHGFDEGGWNSRLCFFIEGLF